MNLKSQNRNKIQDEPPFNIERLATTESSSSLSGYYIKSTANYNVDDLINPLLNRLNIKQIAEELFNQSNPQLVIYVHGYSVKPDDAKAHSQEIYEFAAKNFQSKNGIFIGYRWPAENTREKEDFPFVDRDKLLQTFSSLPTLLLLLLIAALVIGLTSFLLTIVALTPSKFLTPNWISISLITFIISILLSLGLRRLGKAKKVLRFSPSLLITALSAAGISACFNLISQDENLWLRGFMLILLISSIIVLSIVSALILLRLSTYPRDRYRASNYGVVDLVELLRNLDKEVFKLAAKDILPEEKSQLSGIDDRKIGKKRIKLSFIAHSLGCEIATQTIRNSSEPLEEEDFNGLLETIKYFKDFYTIEGEQLSKLNNSIIKRIEELRIGEANNIEKKRKLRKSLLKIPKIIDIKREDLDGIITEISNAAGNERNRLCLQELKKDFRADKFNKELKRIDEKARVGWQLESASAVGFDFRENDFDEFRFRNFATWLTASYRGSEEKASPIEFLGVARYTLDEFEDDTNNFFDLGAGLVYRLQETPLAFTLEYVRRFGDEGDDRFVGIADYRINNTYSVFVSYGKDFEDNFDGNDDLVTLFGLKVGLGRNAEISEPIPSKAENKKFIRKE